MTDITVLNADGDRIAVPLPLEPGRAAAAASKPIALSTEDLAAINAITAALATNHTDEAALHTDIATTLHGDLTALKAVFPTTIDTNSGVKSGSTLRIVLATDQPVMTNAQPVLPNGPTNTSRIASSAASTNATNAKTSAGRIYQATGKNNAAYDVFLVLYDAATNPPVPGTTTIRKKLVCPAGQAFVYDFPGGVFANGIGYAFTKLVADADTTAIAAADITAFNLDYA